MGLIDGLRRKLNMNGHTKVDTSINLPNFKYHPEPVKTGSVQRSDNVCKLCHKKTGYIYVGPVYSKEELDEGICPWCIASGEAHEKFDAQFTDIDGIGDHGNWEEIPIKIKEEVAFRTPGFTGWQQERWWTHCGDAAIFLGRAGKDEIENYGQELIEELRKDVKMTRKQWEYYFEHLNKDDSPTAYIFQCRKCGNLGGYSDCH